MRRVTRLLAGILLAAVAVVALFLAATVYNSYYEPSYAARSKVGKSWRTDGFTVAVVWPPHQELSFVQGVKLALDEANSQHRVKGKISLKEYVEDWDGTGASGASIAHKVVADSDVIAVLGHEVAASSIPASLTYENHGVLFLTPKSTDPVLTAHGFRYTFRLTPNDHEIAEAMMKFAADRGWKRVGVYFARSTGGNSIGEQLISAAEDEGETLVFSRSYLPVEGDLNEMDFRPMISEVSKDDIDAVMLGDRLPRGAKLVTDLRAMGMNKPIIACDKLDSGDLWFYAHQAANQVFVASAVDPDATTPEFLAFKEKFHRRYGQDPGYGPSQGYESFRLLTDAIWRSNSAEPLISATTIRDNTWKGLFGQYSFSPEGDVQGRHISIKQQENGRFTTVSLLTSERK